MKQGQIEQVTEMCQGLDMIMDGCPPLLFEASNLERRLLQTMRLHKSENNAVIADDIARYRVQYDRLQQQAQSYWQGGYVQ